MTQDEFKRATAAKQLETIGYFVQSVCPSEPHQASQCSTKHQWVRIVDARDAKAKAQAELEQLRCKVANERLVLDDVKRELACVNSDIKIATAQRDERRAERDAFWKRGVAIHEELKKNEERLLVVQGAIIVANEAHERAMADVTKARETVKSLNHSIERITQARESARAEATKVMEARETARLDLRRIQTERARLAPPLVYSGWDMGKGDFGVGDPLAQLESKGQPMRPAQAEKLGAKDEKLGAKDESWAPANTRNAARFDVLCGPYPTLKPTPQPITIVDVNPVRSTLGELGPMKPGDVVVWPQRPGTNDTRNAAYMRTANGNWFDLHEGRELSSRSPYISLDEYTPNWVRAKVRV